MTKFRVFMFAAVAAIVGIGACAQPALALDPHFKMATISRAPVANASPNATVLVHQGITAMGVPPPLDASSADTWPCFTGGSDVDCSSIAPGGLVIGIPFYTWPLTSCTSSTLVCGQIYWTFETDVTSTKTPLKVSISVAQGTTTIMNTGTVTLGTNPGAGFTEIISDDVAFGPGDCAVGTCGTPVAGPAVITVTTTIGTQKATGKYNITLQ